MSDEVAGEGREVTGEVTRPERRTPLEITVESRAPLPDDPHPGRYGWLTRGHAPGLDATAVDAAAVARGYLPTQADETGLPGFPGEYDASGELAGPMALAFATGYDRVVALRLGITAELGVGLLKELEGLLAFAYAAAVRLAERIDPDDPVRPQRAPEGRRGA